MGMRLQSLSPIYIKVGNIFQSVRDCMELENAAAPMNRTTNNR